MAARLRIENYHKKAHSVWNTFVAQSNNGTLFHDLNFLSYHPQGRFEDHHLMFYRGERLVGVMPLAITREPDGGLCALSPYGASFGGIVHCEHKFHSVNDMVRQLVAYLIEKDVETCRIVLPPTPYHHRPDAYQPFALLRHGFQIKDRRITSVIPLAGVKSAQTLFSKSAWRNARKARAAGVTGRLSDDYASFYSILQQTIEVKHGSKITHSYAELLRLRELIGNRMTLFLAFVNDVPVAGVLGFAVNANCFLAFYNAFLEEYQAYRPLNLVFLEVIHYALAHGFSYVDLGATGSLYKPVNWGLFRFKESLGAIGYFRDSYVWRRGETAEQ